MDESTLEIANRFAAALDAEAYENALLLLDADCVYESPDGTLIGPESIIASYRANGDRARSRFDEITYSSAVEESGVEFVITYTDRLRLGDRRHQFRCRQRVRFNAEGRIVCIRHEEIPGERERLREFEGEVQ
jgi:hypothetical protein